MENTLHIFISSSSKDRGLVEKIHPTNAVLSWYSGLQHLTRANALRNPDGHSRLVAGNCFRPGGLRRCLFDVEPARRRFKMGRLRKAKKIKRENGKN